LLNQHEHGVNYCAIFLRITAINCKNHLNTRQLPSIYQLSGFFFQTDACLMDGFGKANKQILFKLTLVEFRVDIFPTQWQCYLGQPAGPLNI